MLSFDRFLADMGPELLPHAAENALSADSDPLLVSPAHLVSCSVLISVELLRAYHDWLVSQCQQ